MTGKRPDSSEFPNAERPTIWTLVRRHFAYVRPLSIGGLVAFVVLWELSQYGRDLRPLIAYPSDVLAASGDMLFGSRQQEYLGALWTTTSFLFLAYGAGALFGIVVGFAVGHFWILRVTVYPYFLAIYSTPRLALLPLFVIWLGISPSTAVAVVFVAAGFTVLIGTAEGVQNARIEYLTVARSFGANELQRIFKVVGPASAPYMTAALRLGAGRSVTAVLAAELFLSSGLGRLLVNYSSNFALDRAFFIIVTIAVLASGWMGLFGLLGSWVEMRHGRSHENARP